MQRTRTTIAGAVLVTVALLATGCTTPTDRTEEPSPTVSPDPTPGIELPDHAAGRAAAWVLAVIGPDYPARLSEADLERFAPSFLDEIPTAQLEVVLAQLRAGGPWTPTSVEGTESELAVLITGSAGDLQMLVTVDGAEQIIGLWFGEPPTQRDEATSWDGLLDEVAALDGEVSLTVARVGDDGTCTPVEGLPVGSAAGEALPIGSMIKLYVLAAVVAAVADGDLTWTDEVTVTDAMRSLPSGRLQDEPDGSVVTVREAAELMISISDNTATDLLIEAAGRDRVEAAFTDLGMADPTPNVPVVTTREFFHLGWAAGGDVREQWASGDEAQRRVLVDAVPAGQPVVDVAALMADPVWEHGLDWFGTGVDLCAAHAGLQRLAATAAGEPVREILAINPGIAVDTTRWSYVGFKGGSAPGTMGGSWYAEPAADDADDDGAATVVVLQAASPTADGVVDAATMVGVVQDAFRLLP